MTPTPATLRKELETSLKQAGMSANACGTKAGVDAGTIRQFLAKKRDKPGDMIKIACVLPDDSPIGKRYAEEVSARRAQNPAPAGTATPGETVLQILHKDIEPDPKNYRKSFTNIEEFGAELARDGLMQALTIRFVDNKARIIAGERRWRAIGAAIKLGLWDANTPIPCRERPVESETEARLLSIIENVQREKVPRVEHAEGLRRLHVEHELTIAEIAERLDMKKTSVGQAISLVTKLIPAALKLVEKDEMTFEDARKLWTIPEKMQQVALKQYKANNGNMPWAIRRAFEKFPPLSAALFDEALYVGGIANTGQEKYALDLKSFEKLQQKALADLISKLDKKWKEVRQGQGYFEERHFSKTKDRKRGFAYVQVTPPDNRKGWTTARVHEGFIQKKANVKAGKVANTESKLTLTAQQRINACNLKTLVLQQYLSTCSTGHAFNIPLAISTVAMLKSLFAFGHDGSIPTRIKLDEECREGIPFRGSPLYKIIMDRMDGLRQMRLFNPGEKGHESFADVFPDPQKLIATLITFPHTALQELFTASVAASTGTWPNFNAELGDEPITIGLVEMTNITLQGTWKMKEDYLQGHKIAALKQIAIACGIADPNMPQKKKDAIAWILNHPDRDPDWLAPELKFGYRADITKEVDDFLNKPITPAKPAKKKEAA